MLRRAARWILRTVMLVGGPVAIAIAGLTIYVSGGRYVTTENAYVKADLIVVTAEVSGRVTEVAVTDNTRVRAGDVLFRIAPERFEIERDRRAAELDAARQRLAALEARYRVKQAELAAARGDAEFLDEELARSERLRSSGTISQFRLLEVRREAANATRRLDVIAEEIAEVRAAIGDPGRPADRHPDVLRAKADLERAELDLAAATVHAPADAIAANVALQPGEYVEAGDPVMSLVDDARYWVEANLKETDLTHLALGQTATLRVDAYPDIAWTARVASLAPATGAEYAVLPPQNASGNWVKVVQRVPVRLAIDPAPDAPALRAGMSVVVSIDTLHERPLPEVLSTARAWVLPAE